MKVTVKYMAQLKQAAGVSDEVVDLEQACTVPQLIQHLVARHAEPFRRILLDSDGGVHHSILLFIGDEQVRGDSPRLLQDGDLVTFLAPMAGGDRVPSIPGRHSRTSLPQELPDGVPVLRLRGRG
jgi:molybdopterin converting factor small subunit